MIAPDLFSAPSFDHDGSPRIPAAPVSLAGAVRGETKARPLNLSRTPEDVDLTALATGLSMLRLEPAPQQLVMGRVLEAKHPDGITPTFSEVSVLLPRRASKSTTIMATMLGRCATRPGYLVVMTAQTYVKARELFLTFAGLTKPLATNNVGDYRILRGAAAEAIEWTNGSRLWLVTPEGAAFRSAAADVVWVDEAQEHGPEAADDILGGALALMDTRPGQLIISGTAGESRAGMLWDSLEGGRVGTHGIVEYAVPDGTALVLDPKDAAAAPVLEVWPKALKLTKGTGVLNVPRLLEAHPGIGTLTTLDIILDRWQRLTVESFSREYGGLWPMHVDGRAIQPADWKACAGLTPPARPERYALAFDVAPDQSSAGLVAAWRDSAGVPWWEVVDHQAGDGWLPRSVWEHTRNHRRVPVGYDGIGPNQAIADRLEREAKPRPILHRLGLRDITSAAATADQLIRSHHLRYVKDPALDDAADVAAKRPIGDGSWAWGRRRSGGDVSLLIAASNALRTYDQLVQPRADRHPSAGTARRRVRSAASLPRTAA